MSKYGNAAGTRPKYTTYRAQLAEQSKQEAAQGHAQGLDTGWTMASYMISGLVAYGLIGWLLARFTHVQILFPVGMLFGIAVSTGYVIYRYGRPEKQLEKRPEKQSTQTQQEPERNNR
jgi:F0F1-type ATP synthase assembly protein I